MGFLRRFFDRLSESDEARHAAEIKAWSERVPGAVRIAGAPLRQPVKLAGVVRRLTVFPVEGQETLEALLFDGTGDAVVVFMGRRGIPGMTLGTRLVVEGVLGEKHGDLRMVNPRFEFTT
ncbi:MAG: DNA-binding protein [Thermoplasmata archaeon]|nr:DNA-binding protein [Thermoplasmata archaeon]